MKFCLQGTNPEMVTVNDADGSLFLHSYWLAIFASYS